MLTNEDDIAECMNEYFASVFTAENLVNFPLFDQVIKDKDLSLLQCSPEDVSKILSKLKPRESPRPDSIHPMILKECAGTLASSLCDVFHASFASSMLPYNWKLADITPLHKKGAKNDRKNYRPVSLTSVVYKVCEMIVRQQLVQFWITNEVFIPELFGFLKGKSCVSQLLSSFHDWASERNKGFTTDYVFLDLSKTFEPVPHERRSTKIHAYGIQGPLLSWLGSFLTNRTVLGPILFLIYINDISLCQTQNSLPMI